MKKVLLAALAMAAMWFCWWAVWPSSAPVTPDGASGSRGAGVAGVDSGSVKKRASGEGVAVVRVAHGERRILIPRRK